MTSVYTNLSTSILSNHYLVHFSKSLQLRSLLLVQGSWWNRLVCSPFCVWAGFTLYQVVDQYLSFIAPSSSLFSLLSPVPSPAVQAGPSQPKPYSSYKLLNSPSSTEQQIEDEIERIANGIFSAVVTAGTRSQQLLNIQWNSVDPQDMSRSFVLPREMQQKWWPRSLTPRFGMRYFPPHAPMERPPRFSRRIPLDCPICKGHVRFFILYLSYRPRPD